MKLLRYFKNNKKKIYCISNKDLNISNSLYSKNLYKWIQKEVSIRKKYGPNLTKKISKILNSNSLILHLLFNNIFPMTYLYAKYHV